jgi:inhibitor of KinA sporulation pathway (predicted exonuclease)
VDPKYDSTDKMSYQEIIEFPCVVVDIEKKEIKKDLTFHYYCKINNKLTNFATYLTGITEVQTEFGMKFEDILKLHSKWFYDNFTDSDNNVNALIVTCGDWDLKTMLPTQCSHIEKPIPSYMKEWCNIKKLFRSFYGTHPKGMKYMLDYLGLTLDGKHHSGIDDCKNIAKVSIKMLEDGAKFKPTWFNH